MLIAEERRFLFARGVLFILLYLYSLYIVVTLMSEVFKKLQAFDLFPKCIKSDAKKGEWKNGRGKTGDETRPFFSSRSRLPTAFFLRAFYFADRQKNIPCMVLSI